MKRYHLLNNLHSYSYEKQQIIINVIVGIILFHQISRGQYLRASPHPLAERPAILPPQYHQPLIPSKEAKEITLVNHLLQIQQDWKRLLTLPQHTSLLGNSSTIVPSSNLLQLPDLPQLSVIPVLLYQFPHFSFDDLLQYFHSNQRELEKGRGYLTPQPLPYFRKFRVEIEPVGTEQHITMKVDIQSSSHPKNQPDKWWQVEVKCNRKQILSSSCNCGNSIKSKCKHVAAWLLLIVIFQNIIFSQ
jgi:hypothetical protein